MRWATPVIHFRRTATQDTELGGQKLRAGEKIVLWYNSANRDEAVFDGPVPLRRDAHAERARRLRRPGRAPLPGRQPRAARDHGGVPRALPPAARSRDHRRAGDAALELHPRHQAHAVRVHAGRSPVACAPVMTAGMGGSRKCGELRSYAGHFERGDRVATGRYARRRTCTFVAVAELRRAQRGSVGQPVENRSGGRFKINVTVRQR